MKLRAVVLAAGFGMRLRPLTETRPKPLLPVLGRSILERTLDALAEVGCEATAINLHHAGEAIPPVIGMTHGDMAIHYSPEEEILGTLGALAQLRSFLKPADLILLLNGDSLCRWPLASLLKTHRKRSALVSLLLASKPEVRDFGGGVTVDKKGRILSFSSADDSSGNRRAVFAGAHVLDPRLLERVPEAKSDSVRDLYEPMLKEGKDLWTFTTRRSWHDLGTPGRYLDALLDWGRGRGPGRLWRKNWLGDGVRVGPSVKLQKVVLEKQAAVGRGSRLREVAVLPGARVGPRCELERVVVGPGAVIPANSKIFGRMITRKGHGSLPPKGSQMGELVYLPMT